MVRGFRHRGLKRLYANGDASRLDPRHVDKLREILLVLDAASAPNEVDVPGFRLHRLRPVKEGRWSVWVSGNWRVTFRFEGRDVMDVDYEDYH